MVETSMTTDLEACRAVFERVIEDAGSYDFTRDAVGDYVKPDTWEAFQGFKAAWSARPTQPFGGLVEKLAEAAVLWHQGEPWLRQPDVIDIIKSNQPTDWKSSSVCRAQRKAPERADVATAGSTPPSSAISHASDCALHDGPAFEPGDCDCGAEPDMTPERYGSERPRAHQPAISEERRGELVAAMVMAALDRPKTTARPGKSSLPRLLSLRKDMQAALSVVLKELGGEANNYGSGAVQSAVETAGKEPSGLLMFNPAQEGVPCIPESAPATPQPTGLCSAHRYGEDKGCRICYPKPDEAELREEIYGAIYRTHNGELRNIDEVTDSVLDYVRPYLRSTPPAEPTEDEFLAALQSTINNHWETSMSTPEIARRIRAALSDAGFTVKKVA